MTRNRKLMALSFATIATLSAFSYAQANKVRAETTSKYSPVVQNLITKFNLNTSEVDSVIQQTKSERQTQRLDKIETKLDDLVTQNKITSVQKDKILAKFKEWQDTRNSWQSLTVEQRQQKMQEHRTELLNWAKDNGIDAKYLIGFGRGQFFKGYARGYKAGINSDQ